MNRIHYIIFILTLSITAACTGQQTKQDTTQGDTIHMQYAHNLCMVQYPDGISVQMRNPWDTTQVLHQYWLSADGSTRPGHDAVRIPVQHAGVFTSVHAALMYDMGVADAITGVCEPEYIHNPQILKRISQGKILDLGSGMQPNIERIMQLNPDIVMPSPFQDNGGYGRLEQIGIPIIECADYMETSPLGRAEWMRFYGRLFGVAERADSMFQAICTRYQKLQQRGGAAKRRPTLLAEHLSSSTWYMPAGHSTMGIMYQHAGAQYPWADTPESGALNLSLEAVLDRGIDADIWLLKYNQNHPLTLTELAAENLAYSSIRAYRIGQIYGCNTSTSGFYEETPFHPDLLLQDLIHIVQDHTDGKYYQRLR